MRKSTRRTEENFGTRLACARKEAQLTGEVLGERIGVTKSQISRYESGKDYPDWDKLISITREVRRSADFLLTGAESSEGAMVDPETYKRLIRLKKLPDVLQEFVEEALSLAESTADEIPAQFLKPPTKETWPDFHKYLVKLAQQLQEQALKQPPPERPPPTKK